MVEAEEGNSWIYKNKDHGSLLFSVQLSDAPTDLLPFARSGMLSATASLGLSLLWDTEIGLSHVDKYMYSSEEYIKVSRFSSRQPSLSEPSSDHASPLLYEYRLEPSLLLVSSMLESEPRSTLRSLFSPDTSRARAFLSRSALSSGSSASPFPSLCFVH